MDRDRLRLQDIVTCAAELVEYLDGVDLDAFLEDRMRRRAVERVVTVIGEAAKQLSDETRAAIPQPWREIMRLRDKGVHTYDSLSPATLYRIATESVPSLAAAVERYLSSR